MKLIYTLLFLFALSSSLGWSAPKKKLKKTSIKRARIGGIPKIKAERAQKPISLKDIEPPHLSRIYYSVGTDEAELEDIQNQEIKHLFKLLKKKRSATLILRLASLYVEKARLIGSKLQVDYNNKLSAYNSNKRKTRPRLNLTHSIEFNKKANKLFAEHKKRYPNSKRADEVLFFLGFNHYQMANEKEGAKYFHELESRFPSSSFLYEAYFQLGEHYFQKKNWKKSQYYYKKVSVKKKQKFYFLSLFKLAWSLYKGGSADKALAYLERVIKEGQRIDKNRDHRFTFIDEATLDLILFYTYSKRDPKKARSYFYSLLPEDQALAKLKKLAYNYKDTGHAKGVVAVFSDLIDENPLAIEAFDYQYQIVRTLYDLGSVKQLLKNLKYWIGNYNKKQAWARANRKQKDVINSSYAKMETTVRGYALKEYRRFRSNGSPKIKNTALKLYDLYFSEFHSSPFADQMNFFYAEILFDSKQYGKAVTKYENVISRFPKSKYVEKSYNNQIIAFEELLPKKPTSSKKQTPVALPSSANAFIKYGLRYLNKFPKKSNAPSVLYRIAALYYNHNQFDKAAEHFKKLYFAYPQFKERVYVGGVLLSIYSENKDHASLQKLASDFVKNKNISPSLLKEARSVLRQLSFKKAQDLSEQKKYSESAQLYEKFVKINPSSELAPLAYYNAGINFEKTLNFKQAIKMYESMLAYRKADPKLKKKVQQFLPVLYERLGFYAQAAKAYSSYARTFPKDKKSNSYWYNAGVIYDALNFVSLATKAYTSYFKSSKTKERYQAWFLLAGLYERNKKWKQAIQFYKTYIKSPSSNPLSVTKSHFKLAELYKYRLKNLDSALFWYNKTIEKYKQTKKGVFYAAASDFYKSLKIYDRFQSVSLRSLQNQKTQVAKKLSYLKSLEKSLANVIKYNDGEHVISSLVLIGLANHKMAESIYRAPLPKGLDKKGKEVYRAGIKKVIDPYLKEAVRSYKASIDKSSDFKAHSYWIRQASKGLYSILMDSSGLKAFRPMPITKEGSPVVVFDDMGLSSSAFFKRWKLGSKYKVSDEERREIYRAIKNKNEKTLLDKVSQILDKDSKNIFALHALSYFYIKKKSYRLGHLIINRALKIKPQAALLNNLGAISSKEYETREAIAYYKRAIKADSSYTLPYANLGSLFAIQGNFIPAKNYLQKAYENLDKLPSSFKNHVAIYNNYGLSLAGAGSYKKARAVYEALEDKFPEQKRVLLNKAIVLVEGFKKKNALDEAQGLADELFLTEKSVRFRKKLDKILSRIKLKRKQK